MDTYEGEKYHCDVNGVKDMLKKYGVAIVPSVLTNEEAQAMRDGLWDSIEHITQAFDVPIKRDDSKTWKSFQLLYPLHSMLIQRDISHAQYYWDLRCEPAIISVFANIWGVDANDLLVSFDGISLHLPPEITGRGHFKGNTWYHTDQRLSMNDFACVQSFVSANEIRQGDATLSFLEGSHKYHGELAKKFAITDKTDWYKFNKEEQQFYLDKGCIEKCIMCPQGSLVLFDSRLAHMGIESLKERAQPNERIIAYLCYTPRSRATKSNLKKKIKAFEEMRTTNHLAHAPKLFAKNPRTYGGPMPNITALPAPVVSDLGKRLIGY